MLSESDFSDFELNCVTTPVAAINEFRANAHDVCIIDSVQRGFSEFLAGAKSVSCQIPMIVLTSSTAQEVLEAFHAGAADCLIRANLTGEILQESICKTVFENRLNLTRLENEQRYLGLVQNAKDIIYTHDLEGNYTSANQAAQTLTGYSLEEILCLNAKQVIAPEYLNLSHQMVDRKLDEQKETSYELEIITKDGNRVPIEVNTHLIYSSGKPVGVQGIARDIRQRKAFEAALQESELRYRELVENANDIIYVHDLKGNFLSLNHAGELLTEYTRAEALQMNVCQVVAPFHLKQVMGMISRKAVEDVQTRYELDIVTKSGRIVSLEVSSRILTREGVPIAIEGIGRDITARKRAELERSVILEIIQSVTLTSNLDDLLRMIHQALKKILSADNCFVALDEPGTGLFTRPFFVDTHGQPPPAEKLKRGMTAYVFRTGEPLLLNDKLYEELVAAGEVEVVGHYSPSWLGVPLKTPSQTIGVLVVQDYERAGTYTAHDLEFLSSVGGQIALAIERKRTEGALKKSEAEFRSIFDNAPVGVYRSTRDGRFVTANPALARILGYSSVSELFALDIGKDIYFDPEERERLIRSRLPAGSVEGTELLWKKKDGSPIWIRLTAIGTRDEAGNTVFDVFINDIAERKEAEKALKETEERYQRLVELSPDGIIVHTDGIISFVNSAGVTLMGAPDAQSIVGRSIFDFIDPVYYDVFKERIARLQRGEYQSPVEVTGIRWDGSRIDCEVMSVPFTTHEKPAVQVVVRNITERKLAANALSEANRRALADYERLVERIAVLGQSLGNARDLTAVLRAIRDFTQASVPCDGLVTSLYEPEKGSRRAVYCWIDGAEVEPDQISFPVGNGMTGIAIKSGAIVTENDYESSLGKDREISSRGEFIEDRIPRSALAAPMTIMGRTVGCIEIQSYERNVYTEEHKTAMRMAASLAANAVENVMLMEREQEKADQLRQSQKMEAVGQLAGGVAHDFNNLLTAISGYSDLGLRRLKDNDPLRRNLEEIKKASTRAGSLTRQLLAFSRKQMLLAKVFDLNSVVSDMDRMLRRLISEDIDLLTLLDPMPCQLKADPGQIEQVIMNLAVNARDAMPKGGRLRIETSHVNVDDGSSQSHMVRPGHYVMLAVSDTGEGMDRETQKRVFEPFFTTKAVGKGTGLGLSTVHGIVNQSGGAVSVESEPGKGTTFKVYLPAVVDEKLESHEPKGSSLDLLQGRETILLVEDEEMVRNLTREILEMNGYKVLVAANGEEACLVCDKHSGEIDLLVTDVVMPIMGGREVVERVSKKHPDILVLYMSGYTDDAIVRHGVLDDGVPFLHKPFTPESLARKVRELIESAPLRTV